MATNKAMHLREELRIGRPADDVWNALQDPELVFGCVPGARYEGRESDGSHAVTVTLEADPDRLVLEASILVTGSGRRSATADLRVVERGSGGRARGGVAVEVEGHGLFSMIRVSADLTLTGSVADAARRGYLGEAVHFLGAAFAECLDRSSAGEVEAPRGVAAVPRAPVPRRRGLIGRLWDGLRGR